ncbi:MAG: sigma 54-interacting transcriptional regulator [Planctomycetes bacterium]|nr:sigma 54-interacting transcriptional regulator [Planctomycetota bacterium]
MTRYLVGTQDGIKRVIELSGEQTTVGRSPKCDLVIDSTSISRVHCIIVKKGSKFVLQDLKSRNGTYVNNHKIDSDCELKLNDAILIGEFKFTFTEKKEPALSNTQSVTVYDKNTSLILDTITELSREDEINKLCKIILSAFIKLADAKRGSIVFVQESGTTPIVCVDDDGNDIKGQMEFCESILRDTLQSGKELFIQDHETKSNYSMTMVQHKIVSVYAAPIMYRKKVIGSIYLDSNTPLRKFDDSKRELLTTALRYFSAILGEKSQRDTFLHTIRMRNTDLELENFALKGTHEDKIVGESDVIYKVLQTVRKISDTDVTVLLTGESGTGKELFAKYIHKLSKRENNPFIVVDCSNIPLTLVESELYGYEKGSFTGAVESRVGKIEAANGGTIFLDEISELPLEQQKKLLRFLQEKEILRIGSNKPIKVDARVVAATNKELQSQIQQGLFREDLYYRLNVMNVRIPPLRERKSDIPLLVDYFIKIFNKKYNKNITGISNDSLEYLMKRRLNGNIRELKHVIEQALVLCDGDEISSMYLIGKTVERIEPLHVSRDKFEREYILNCLLANNFNVSRSAEILGISSQHLQNHINKFGIKRP